MKVLAQEYLQAHTLEELINPYLREVEQLAQKKVSIQVNPNLKTPAKIRIAEYYGEDSHTLYLKEEPPINAYYVWHELTHLKLIAEARQTEDNEIFTTAPEHYSSYTKRMSNYTDV